MDYRTIKSPLLFREYGRNIQNLVSFTMTIEDDNKRNEVASSIIDLMGHLNPHLKNVDDFKHKLWDHLFILSDFKLDVESPFPIPTKEELSRKPDHIGYPIAQPEYKQYGKNVETMIAKAIEMEDEEKKKQFTAVIGSYMKLVYKNWNRETVSDDVIIADLKMLSKNQLVLDENMSIDTLSKGVRTKKSKRPMVGKGRENNNRRKQKNYRK